MLSKEFYRTYLADNLTVELNDNLAKLVSGHDPNHVLEYGCGTGKNLRLIQSLSNRTTLMGIDVSPMNIIHAQVLSGAGFMYACGDENYLRNMCNFDVVFTCSVLDHIEDVDAILLEFQRIANKAVYLAETKDVPGPHYYSHDYENFGFKRIQGTKWVSNLPDGDGCTYHIWEWQRTQATEQKNFGPHDDLG